MTDEQYCKALRGVSGVHATAYKDDGEIDAALTGRIVQRIARAGVHNIVAGGNTGEFFSLTDAEIRQLHVIAVQAAAGGAAVTAAVGRSLKEAIATARAAKREGVDGVMVHQPRDPFAAPMAQIDYFLHIADAVDLPVVAYVRADDIPLAGLVRLATHPAIAGVKFASKDLMLFGDCIRATQGLNATWICGLAERWALPFYALGGAGFTSGLVNVAPELSLATWQALEAGDYARARDLVNLIAPFEDMRTQFRDGANVTVVKEALQLQGLPVGQVRLPGLPALSGQDRQALHQILNSWKQASAA